MHRKRCQACGQTYETPSRVPVCGCGHTHVTGYVPDDIEELSKKFKLPPQGVTDYHYVMGYAADEGWVPGSATAGHTGTDEALLTYVERYPDEWEVVKRCLGLARQKGRHACAFVIANKAISDWIPMTSVSGVRVTSFTAPAVEAVGGLKMDFLVVNSLNDIQHCIRLAQERSPAGRQREAVQLQGRRVPAQRLVLDPVSRALVDIWDLPEDQAVFTDVAEGRTETVFQFNTPGARQWMQHFNYTRADGTKAIRAVADMAAFTALDRPGPLDVMVKDPDWLGPPDHPDGQHNMLVEFARRARGAARSPDVLPILDELVPETYGILTYQEQLQRVYQHLTGCSGSEAETFRTDVAKKKKERVDAAYPAFMERSGAKIGAENSQRLWDVIKTWAQYGFNKSHAVCYAVIAYACAWLKHHYPLEWWASVLRNASKEEINDKFWPFVADLALLPDLQLSQPHWVIEGAKIRAPISLLHGVGEKAHVALCAYAPYASLDDLAEKLVAHRDAARVAVIKTKILKKGPKEYVEHRLGRGAIARGTVWSLIVAGTMDSLVAPGASVAGTLTAFDTAMLAALGRRYDAATALADKPLAACWQKAYKAYQKGATTAYGVLDPLTRYQIRKAILPAYGADLRVLYLSLPLPACLRLDGRKLRYVSARFDFAEKRRVEVVDPVLAPDKVALFNTTEDLPHGGYRCAVVAYLQEKRAFAYGPGKSKKAMSLTMDVGGGKHEFVYWPDSEGRLPKDVEALEAGSILTALLVRKNPDKPFSVRAFTVLREPARVKAATTEEFHDEESQD